MERISRTPFSDIPRSRYVRSSIFVGRNIGRRSAAIWLQLAGRSLLLRRVALARGSLTFHAQLSLTYFAQVETSTVSRRFCGKSRRTICQPDGGELLDHVQAVPAAIYALRFATEIRCRSAPANSVRCAAFVRGRLMAERRQVVPLFLPGAMPELAP